MKLNWPKRLRDEKTGSEAVVLWGGKFSTGWGRPLRGDTREVNRLMILGRPFLKSFGKWERLRPGKPTRAQIAGSILSRVKGANDALDALLGKKEMPRGWSRQRLSKEQRILLSRVQDEVTQIATDVDYIVPWSGEKKS